MHDRAQISTFFGVSYRRLPAGVTTPQSLESRPAQQAFWSARGDDSDATLVLTETRRIPGHYAIVLANADGSPGVAADTSWQLTSSPKKDPLPVLFLLLGLVVVGTGLIVVLRARRA